MVWEWSAVDFRTVFKRKYPYGKNHKDCANYSDGNCLDVKAIQRNKGECDGKDIECLQWEFLG